MKVEKQRTRLPVQKYEFSGGCLKKKHGKLLPGNVRLIACGPSNCGKTNLLVSLLVDKNGLKFQNVYLFSKSSDQPKYEFLEKVIGKIKGMKFFRFENNFLKPEEVEKNSVCVFDDVATDKPTAIQDLFAMGRHRSLDTCYLSQTYSRIPKQLIRDNANLIVLFKMDELNLKHVYSDHVSADMTFNKFRELCSECWAEPHGFIVIDKESEKCGGGYRKGFDCYIKP